VLFRSLTHSSKYNPRGNSQVERYNGELQRVVRRLLRERQLVEEEWEQVLNEALFICRSMVCESTKRTPHDSFFRFGRKVFPGIGLEYVQIPSESELSRGSPVFVRNFVRRKKSDPFVKERGVVTELLTPQLAEVQVQGKVGTQMINTRHLARRPEVVVSSNEGTFDESALPRFETLVTSRSDVAARPPEMQLAPPVSEDSVPIHNGSAEISAPSYLEPGVQIQPPDTRRTRSGRQVKKPMKLIYSCSVGELS
jgi:hypothetical protein